METTTCTGCSLICEDIKVVVENGRIAKNFGCCLIGNEKIRLITSPERFKTYSFEGNQLSAEEAAEKTAEMLKASKKPLLYGWCNSTCEAISLGIRIARKLGGVFDSPLSLYYGYALMEARKRGTYKFTLDDVREEADHLIFWGVNPAETFHRHMSKFSVFPRGLKVERGVESRILTVIDVRQTRTVAHNRLLVKPGEDKDLMETLAFMVETGQYPSQYGLSIPLRRVSSLARDLKRSSFTAIFYGLGLLGAGMAKANLEALYRLVETLEKAGIKCVAMPLPGHYNSLGFLETALKEAGAPYAIDFSEGNAKHNPSQTSALAALTNGSVDAALIVGSNPLSSLPAEAAGNLAKLPMAAVDYVETLTMSYAKLKIPTTISGFESGGTVYRVDGVQLQLKPVVKPPEGIVSDEEFLRMVYEKL
ncbi:MAG: formylmethanofuran dehydrogenase subunit B [Candidatus Hecatellaceae archaeon]